MDKTLGLNDKIPRCRRLHHPFLSTIAINNFPNSHN